MDKKVKKSKKAAAAALRKAHQEYFLSQIILNKAFKNKELAEKKFQMYQQIYVAMDGFFE
jgi:hypothetical protein